MKLAFIAMHPAPYRDEFIGRLVRESAFATDVFLVKAVDGGHDFPAPSYPFSRLGLRTMGRIAFGDYDFVVFPAFLPLLVLFLLLWRALWRRPYALCADTVKRRTAHGGGRTLKRFLARRADFILVPGRRAARFVADEYGVPPERILTGMYAFATDRLAREIAAYRAARAEIRAACGIGADEKVFLMVANMIPTRQYPLVAAAFADFAATHPKVRFVMCGKGADLPRMESFAAENPSLTVVPGCSFEEMKKLYAMADVYVHGGAEPASTALVIGAIAGLPLVTSAAVGCADDVLVDGETGVLVGDPLSRSAWADAFGRIAALESRWPALGSAARAQSQSLDLDEVYEKMSANLRSSDFNHQPLLSIVIANYNYGRFLDEAIQSVITQDGFDECELIVVDGGSTDNSVEIIKKYADKIAWWVSEKDKGQSDAFNKGFAKAKGRFLTWLNADDLLVKGCLKKVLTQMRKHPDCEWFTGNYLQFREDTGKVIFAPWGPHWMPWALQWFNAPLVVFGPTTFWSRTAYQKVGLFDESLRYSMDTDYWLRMKKAGYLQRRVNHCCWAFRMHDESKTAQYGERKIDDRVRSRWYEELRIVRNKVGYRSSRWLRILGLLMRVVDGSLFCAAYRRSFIVGKGFVEYQRRMR